MPTCKGITTNGKTCSRQVSTKPNTDSTYCWQHQPKVTTPVKVNNQHEDEDDESTVLPIEDGDYSIERITPIVIDEIDKDKTKGVIWNDNDVWDLLEYLHKYDELEDETEYEAKFKVLIDQLLEDKLIYKQGDKQSYLNLVGKPGLISKSESQMGLTIKDSIKQHGPKNNKPKNYHYVVFNDTEFPVDHDTGRYLPFN